MVTTVCLISVINLFIHFSKDVSVSILIVFTLIKLFVCFTLREVSTISIIVKQPHETISRKWCYYVIISAKVVVYFSWTWYNTETLESKTHTHTYIYIYTNRIHLNARVYCVYVRLGLWVQLIKNNFFRPIQWYKQMKGTKDTCELSI